MLDRFDVGGRARARTAMRRMAESADGPRLPVRPRRSKSRRIVRYAVRAVELVIVIALVAVIALAVRLSNGPIYLETLQQRIASSLQERLNGHYLIDLGRVSLMHDSWGVGLGFDGLTLRDPEGRPVVASPAGKISLNLMALLVGETRVQRLQLEGLDVRLRVAKDGALSLAVASDTGAAPIPLPASNASGLESANLATLIRDGAEAMAGASQAVDHLTLVNGNFHIDNEATGQSATYKNFRLVFDRTGAEASAHISARGPAGDWMIAARAEAGETPTLAIDAQDLSLADLEAFDKKPPPVFVDGPIGFRFDARLSADNTIASLDGQFTLGAGKVRLNNPDALPFLVDEAAGHFAWEPATKRLRIDGLSILAGDTHVEAAAWVKPPESGADPWTISVDSTKTRLGAERPGMTPVELTSMTVRARAFPLESRFVLDEFAAKGPTVDIKVAAEASPEDKAVSLKFNLHINPSVSSDIIRLWPQFINPDVRDWCSHNLHGGQIEGVMSANWSAEDLDAMNHKRAVARDSVHGSFSAHDVGIDLLPGLPVMIAAEGEGVFTGRNFGVTAKSATMVLSATRRIQSTNISFTIPDTSPREIVDAEAAAHLAGSAEALADLLTREPLKKQAALLLDPATVHGQAEGDLTLALKLGKTAKPEDSQFHVTGTVSNLTMDKFIGEEKFQQANLAFDADRTNLKMTGQGELFGVPARIEANRSPGDEGQAALSFTLDPAALAKRGLNFNWLSGSLPVKIKAPLSRTSAAVEVDLTPAAIDNPVPGFAKAAGKPGKLAFQAKSSPGGAALSDVSVDFGSALIRGSAELGPDGAIASAKLAQLKISPGDALQADITVAGGIFKANVRGASLDARPALKAITESGGGSGAGFDLDLKVGAASGANKQALNALELVLSQRNGEVRALQARGKVGQGVFTADRADQGAIRIVSTDGGALIRFADIYTRMEGGALDVTLTTNGGSTAGTATIANFVLRGEPALSQLVAAAPARADGHIDPTRVAFQRMTMTFQKSRGVLDVRDAVIYNPSMGLTASGRVDFPKNDMDLSGTFIPAYAVNNMLNKIPIVGVLLGGGSDEGVFGITYRVRGPIDAPNVSVNPLSAITPGILRKILGVMSGGAQGGDDSKANAPRPTPRR